MRQNFTKLACFLLLLLAGSIAQAQVTTSQMSGEIQDESGIAVEGAEVVAKHEPTGTVYTTTTDADGLFAIRGMRVGGPYSLTVTSAEGKSISESEVFLQLGQTFSYNGQFTEAVELDGVVMTSTNPKYNRGRTGTETVLDREALETLPNVTGGIADFVRITPQARVENDNVISIAGQNNRYNAVYVDGGVDNDVFGLTDSGLDGGGSGGSPFGLDELDQITVSVAPYDVRQSGFAGGAINATTRSGTNELHGSLYYLGRNETLAGRTAEYDKSLREGLNEFNADRLGFSLGGAIVKDKLFFFATYENENIQTPAPFNEGTYIGDSQGTNQIAQLLDRLQTNFGYNPGTFGSINETLEKHIFASRLDWNINPNHTLSFKYKYSNFDNFDAANSSPNSLQFSDRSILRPNRRHQYAIDWNADWSDIFSSQVLVNYKTVRDDRDPAQDFPTLTLEDGAGSVNLGSEFFSTSNNLEQDVLGIIANVTASLGKHTLLAGFQFDNYDIVNQFIRGNYGNYRFDNNEATGQTGLERFLAGELADEFDRNFSIIPGDTVGDNNEGAAANFSAQQVGFLLQDEWNATNNLRLTLGLRFDLPIYEDTRLNQDFNDAIPDFEAAGYDLEGARTGSSINSSIHFSPRVGFNWTPKVFDGLKTYVRGGVGVFTSRIPLVWIGGAYANTGNTIGFVRTDNIAFNPDITTNNGLSAASSQPQIDIFAEDFKLPQRLKASIGIDQKLPEGFTVSLDYQYDNVINDVLYQNINIEAVGNLTGPDNRTVWNRRALINNNFDRVLLGTNTSEGYGHTVTVGVNKKFWQRLETNVAWTFNDSYAINNGTSSQNSSQWRNLPTINGKNTAELGRADYSLGHRLTGLAAYTVKWNSGSTTKRTKFAMFYEGIEGAPYSYTYNDRGALLNDDSRENALIFVPNDISQINLREGYRGLTRQQQWDALNGFIEGDSYLRERRGDYAERNQRRLPWSNIVDLRVIQEFDINVLNKTHTLAFSFDIFNFTNLINRNWGRLYTDGGLFNGYQLIDVLGVTDNGNGTFTPEYGINTESLNNQAIEQFDNFGTQSSIWQMQFGIKYTF